MENSLNFISIFECVILTVTLCFIALQSYIQLKIIKEMQKERRAASISNLTRSVIETNFMLINNEDLAQNFGYSKEEILAFILLNIFEEKFHFFKEGLITNAVWEGNKQTMSDVIKKEFVYKMWDSRQHVYDKGFRDLVNEIINK